jgi:hypothetical protein
MEEMRFQNKVRFSEEEFLAIAKAVQENFS